jgi:hypothetical protein
LCGNCAAILGRRPLTLPELRAELAPAGERRQRDRRRRARRAAGDRRDVEGVFSRSDDAAAALRSDARSRGRRAGAGVEPRARGAR